MMTSPDPPQRRPRNRWKSVALRKKRASSSEEPSGESSIVDGFDSLLCSDTRVLTKYGSRTVGDLLKASDKKSVEIVLWSGMGWVRTEISRCSKSHTKCTVVMSNGTQLRCGRSQSIAVFDRKMSTGESVAAKYLYADCGSLPFCTPSTALGDEICDPGLRDSRLSTIAHIGTIIAKTAGSKNPTILPCNVIKSQEDAIILIKSIADVNAGYILCSPGQVASIVSELIYVGITDTAAIKVDKDIVELQIDPSCLKHTAEQIDQTDALKLPCFSSCKNIVTVKLVKNENKAPMFSCRILGSEHGNSDRPVGYTLLADGVVVLAPKESKKEPHTSGDSGSADSVEAVSSIHAVLEHSAPSVTRRLPVHIASAV